MRELGREAIVAATIATINKRPSADAKAEAVTRRRAAAAERKVLLSPRNVYEERRASGISERPLSTASEASERDSVSIQSSEEPPQADSGDSDSPEETVKSGWKNQALPPEESDSSESDTTTSEDDSDEQEYLTRECDSEYATLTPNTRDSTRCDGDFKWLTSARVMDDTVEIQSVGSRAESATASLDRNRRTPGDRGERDRKSRSSLSTKPPHHPSSFRVAKPKRLQNEVPQTEVQRRWNSYEHFRCPEGGWWPPMCWCHGPPPQPMVCMHAEHSWPSHPSLPTIPSSPVKIEAEERILRLESEKQTQQMHVQVLSEQISAQADKISDMEHTLHKLRLQLQEANEKLQREKEARLETEVEKYQIAATMTEDKLRTVERCVMEQRTARLSTSPIARSSPPKTPPATYGRLIERGSHVYASLPRSAGPSGTSLDPRLHLGKENVVVAREKGLSVPNLAEQRESHTHGSPTPSLRDFRSRGGSVTRPGESDQISRVSVIYAEPRKSFKLPWQITDVRDWDCETTCSWLAHLSLDMYIPAARAWLNAAMDRGVLATALPHTIEKELGIKHPMHRKKIILALSDLLGDHGDPLLPAAGCLDTQWVLRWLEDVGVSEVRANAAEASLDGRLLHRLSHSELHTHLKVTHALYALSIRRGIQVLRENNFHPETMIRRAQEDDLLNTSTNYTTVGAMLVAEPVPKSQLSRWSSHRVMQWLNEIDLSEYAPNLRGSGVHGGLMVLESRFNSDLLATLLNITLDKTLLRRHLNQKFHDLIGREEIQIKRDAEKSLGFQQLTPTTKYKIPTKKSPFTLRRKKNRDDKSEMDLTDLLCPFSLDFEGEPQTATNASASSVPAAKAACPRDVTRGH